MRIAIDDEMCIGSGQCVLAAEDVFDQRAEDGVVVLLHATPPAGSGDAIRQAAMLCPARAISVED